MDERERRIRKKKRYYLWDDAAADVRYLESVIERERERAGKLKDWLVIEDQTIEDSERDRLRLKREKAELLEALERGHPWRHDEPGVYCHACSVLAKHKERGCSCNAIGGTSSCVVHNPRLHRERA